MIHEQTRSEFFKITKDFLPKNPKVCRYFVSCSAEGARRPERVEEVGRGVWDQSFDVLRTIHV